MILRERVHLSWEVFNWHGYLGYGYIRIAYPVSQECPKTPPCAFWGWDAHTEGGWAHFSLYRVYTEKLVVAVVSGIPAFFSYSHLNATLELVVSYNCPLWVGCVTMTTAAARPVDSLKAPNLCFGASLLLRRIWQSWESSNVCIFKRCFVTFILDYTYRNTCPIQKKKKLTHSLFCLFKQ